MQGAGGVGGLLLITDHSAPGTPTYYPTYDGNGNISEYLDTTGAIAAHYEYDPFGKTTVATGPKANDFAHRFSTKPIDVTTGLYYYAYRFYDPLTGRWPSRDPIVESGGVNLYGFCYNNPNYWFDYMGRQPGAYHAPNWGMPTGNSSSSPNTGGNVPEVGISTGVTGFFMFYGLDLSASMTVTLEFKCKYCLKVSGSALFGKIPGAMASASIGGTAGSRPPSNGFGANNSSGSSNGVGGGFGTGPGGTANIDYAGDDYGDFNLTDMPISAGGARIGPTVGAAAFYRKTVYCESCVSVLIPFPIAQVMMQKNVADCIAKAIGEGLRESNMLR